MNVSEEQTIKTLVYIADEEPVVALLVGNDQLNEVKLKNYLGADFLEPATEAEVKELLGADFGSLGPVDLPENVKSSLTARCKIAAMLLLVPTKMVTT